MEEINPYAPSKLDVAPSPSPGRPVDHELAGLWKRLAARVIDNVLLFAAVRLGVDLAPLPTRIFSDWIAPVRGFIGGEGESRLILLAHAFPLFLLQWGLIAVTGQSLGKLMLRTRIVRSNGDRAGVLRAVGAREGLPLMVSLLPDLGYILLGLDAVAIFTRDRATLHDRVAGTKVVDLTQPIELEDDALPAQPRLKKRRRRARTGARAREAARPARDLPPMR